MSTSVAQPAIADPGAPPLQAPRAAALTGARRALPMVAGLVPLALLIGVTVGDSAVPALHGWAGSLLLFSGAAHLAAVTLLDSGATALAVVGAVAVINARLVMLSAALAPHLRGQPGWFRVVAAHFVVEPTYSLATRPDGFDDAARWRWHYLGVVVTILLGWSGVIGLGTMVGPWLPAGLSLELAGPALLVALLVPALTSRPAVLAAAVGAGVAVATAGLPGALNLLLGGLAGMAAGALADRSS